MLLLSFITATNRDMAVNRLCTVVVPILLVYVGVLCIWGEKLASSLLNRDTYSKKHIKLRPYGIARTSITLILLAVAVIYFLINRIWELALFFSVALLGYSLIKWNTYRVIIQYTNRKITIQSGKTKNVIPLEDISKMSWESVRGTIAYVLVISCSNGNKIKLSSADFIGLKKLKSVFDYRK